MAELVDGLAQRYGQTPEQILDGSIENVHIAAVVAMGVKDIEVG